MAAVVELLEEAPISASDPDHLSGHRPPMVENCWKADSGPLSRWCVCPRNSEPYPLPHELSAIPQLGLTLGAAPIITGCGGLGKMNKYVENITYTIDPATP